MKNQKFNAALVWKQLEDFLVPRLALSAIDRAVYSHLLRHSRLEGKLRFHFSILGLARGVRLTGGPVREAVRRLAGYGALRLIERSKAGHVVEVRLPEEIRGVRLHSLASTSSGHGAIRDRVADLEKADFMQSRGLRQAIHLRERGRCFYCLRQVSARMQCLDHVVPRARFGRNSYRNLVSCCLECNSRKGERAAGDFLRWLYRDGRLTASELRTRLRALDCLAAGKLRPTLGSSANPPSPKGRPPLHPVRPSLKNAAKALRSA